MTSPLSVDATLTNRAEALLRGGRWSSSMIRDDPYVMCPGCNAGISDGRTGSHAYSCQPLRALVRSAGK